MSPDRTGSRPRRSTDRRGLPLLASEAVADRAGAVRGIGLNLFKDTRRGALVCLLQLDEQVYMVGEHSFTVSQYTLDEWLGGVDRPTLPRFGTETAEEALAILDLMREGADLLECGRCADGNKGWTYTTAASTSEGLRCSSCGRVDGPTLRW